MNNLNVRRANGMWRLSESPLSIRYLRNCCGDCNLQWITDVVTIAEHVLRVKYLKKEDAEVYYASYKYLIF